MSTGKLSLSYLDKFPGPAPRSARTYAQLSQELALPFGLLDQVYAGFGLSHPRPDEYVREDDAKIVSGLSIMFAAGLDESEVLRAARVWGEVGRGVV